LYPVVERRSSELPAQFESQNLIRVNEPFV
jgi:hypothetical protein